MIFKLLFSISRFFINTYGLFLKFSLQLNGGYWARIGIAQYRIEEKIKKRNLYILPFYILLALLFGFLSVIYWYFVIAYVPINIEKFLTSNVDLNAIYARTIAFATFFGWLFILKKTD